MIIKISEYKKPAFHFSGGKDSLACLYLLRDQLDKIVVYWLDTGDGCTETHAVIDEVRKWIPYFRIVKSDVKRWREINGNPSDLVPARAHEIGVAYGMNGFRLSNRFDCCYCNLMLPMHNRMVEDKVDCVIRGTKLADTGRLPAEGKTEFYDVLLPIRDWSHDDVFRYLDRVGAPRNRIYDHFNAISAPECMGCTAWWDDGKAKYFKAKHTEQYEAYKDNLRKIARAISVSMDELMAELNN